MAKISVIIPVYNVEEYLKACLDSIVSQVYKDIEILLIDDGSDDGSSDICDEYELKDRRIRVIHTEHVGLSCARNIGISASEATYIMFLDADDWVSEWFCYIALRCAEVNNADIVLFKSAVIDEKGRRVVNKVNINSGIISEIEALKFNLEYTCAVWAGLYKRELFTEIRFPEGKYCEDLGVTHRLIHLAERICYDEHTLYWHRKGRKGSITTEPCTRNTDLYEMRMRRFNDLLKWGYEKLLLNQAVTMMIMFGYKNRNDKNVLRIFKSLVNDPPKDIMFKRKALLVIYRFSPSLFDLLCIVTGRRHRRFIRSGDSLKEQPIVKRGRKKRLWRYVMSIIGQSHQHCK